MPLLTFSAYAFHSYSVLSSMRDKPCRFVDILRSDKKLQTKTLSQNLKLLIKEGLVEHRVVSLTPLKGEYLLTPKGLDMLRILDQVKELYDNSDPGGPL